MKKIRPPLEDVLDSKFFEKIRPRLEGVLFWGEGGAHFFDGGGCIFFGGPVQGLHSWVLWIQSFFEDYKASPRGCFWIQSFIF